MPKPIVCLSEQLRQFAEYFLPASADANGGAL